MATRVLLNTQRKELHEILVKRQIDPAVTKWGNDEKNFTHREVETLEAGLCHFLFSPDDGAYNIHYRPGLDGGAPIGEVGQDWDEVLRIFDLWAVLVAQELQEEDPWQQYSAYLPPERLGQATDNSPFTYQEAQQVTKALDLLFDHVRDDLPQYKQVAQQFDQQFERLAEQAKKGVGRIDWSNQFVGMLISLCMALSLEPDKAASLWKFWLHVIDGLLLT